MKFRITALTLLTAILLAACASAPQPSTGSGLRVLTSTTFLADIAQNVAGDRVKVESLIPATTDPHEYQPKPQDIIKMTESQVLIVNGLGYETWLKSSLDSLQGQRLIITATNGLTPNPDPSNEHPAGDPHMWMNPLNVVQYAENIRDGLIQADPSGRDIYSANTDAYISKLKDLDAWVKSDTAQLAPEKKLLVTNHDALGYFAQAYGFKIVGAIIPSVTTDASPSAQQMASMIDAIKNSGASAIFLDIGENQNLADQIASETKVKVVTDLYVESISSADGPAPTYIDMIKHDVTVIMDALK
jgi:ABC-type Zn uptake system ZnuABC Zn-binding protein ZnuA